METNLPQTDMTQWQYDRACNSRNPGISSLSVATPFQRISEANKRRESQGILAASFIYSKSFLVAIQEKQ